jgi:5-methylcytosine-specific restriction protein A
MARLQMQLFPLCAMCMNEGRVEAAAVVDHIRPHGGNEALFWDAGNLQSLCKRHHEGTKRYIEHRGFDNRIGEDGYPTDPRHPFFTGRLPR